MRDSASQLVPAGFHPTLITTYDTPALECALWVRYEISPAFIVDRFQLSQLHAEGRLGSPPSSYASSLRILGERDLEAPVGRTEESIVILKLSSGGKGNGKERETGTVILPLHMRYQTPVLERWDNQGVRKDLLDVGLREPMLFWACSGTLLARWEDDKS